MRKFEITFGSFGAAIKHHWKMVLVSLLLFSLVGAGAGYWYASNTTADHFFYAQQLEFFGFDEVKLDEDYYKNRQEILSLTCKNTKEYLAGIRSVTTLTQEDRLLLDQQTEKIELFIQEAMEPIDTQLNATDAIYVPGECIPLVIKEYENSLASVQRNLIVSTEAVELIKNMDAPTLENESVLANYNTLLSRAASHGTYLMQQEQYTKILEKLQDAGVIQTESRKLGRMQDAAARELEDLLAEVNEEIASLAQERLLNIVATHDADGVLSVTISHTYRATTAQENFLVVWSFCALTGLCFGAFLALCREARRRNSVEHINPIPSNLKS